MEVRYKEVYFHDYCPKCENWETPAYETPCDECLTEGGVEYSHKPVNFKLKDGEDEL